MQLTKTTLEAQQFLQSQHPGAKIDDSIYKLPADFQLLADQFVGGVQFEKLLSAATLDDDQFLYEFKSTAGTRYYILEMDYVTGFHAVEQQMKQQLGENIRFVAVQSPPKQFFDCPPSAFYVGRNSVPESFDATRQYFNCMYGSEEYYFTFLIEKSSIADFGLSVTL